MGDAKKSRWGTDEERGVYKEPACPKKRIVRGCPNPKDLSLQDIFSAANQSHIGAWRHKREI